MEEQQTTETKTEDEKLRTFAEVEEEAAADLKEHANMLFREVIYGEQ